jgi:hypothetical protein
LLHYWKGWSLRIPGPIQTQNEASLAAFRAGREGRMSIEESPGSSASTGTWDLAM